MARRHARPQSPYLGYTANNAYNSGHVYPQYAPPFYYQPANNPPLPLYGHQTPLPLPMAPYPGFSYSPIPQPIPLGTYGNRAPLPEEMLALQNTLQMKEATIAFLDAQIEAAKDNLDVLAIPYFDLRARYESAQSAYHAAKENHDDLTIQRGNLEQSMQQLSALLHPLRRVPEDVLVRIFAFAVDAEKERDYDRMEGPRSRKHQCIINIIKVSSKWRSAALSEPELFTYVRLNLSDGRRSMIDSNSEDDEGNPHTVPLLLPVRNLRSLTVNYSHYRALQYLPALGTKCLDKLEELHLRSEPLSSPASGLFSIASYLAEAPNLRFLRLVHVHLMPAQPHEATPVVVLPNVQELVMHGPMTHGTEIFGFAQIVSMLPNVEKITFCQNDNVPFNMTDTIQLFNLRELVTNCVALETALRTSFGTHQVTAPKLERLTINDLSTFSGAGPAGPGGGPLAAFLEAVGSVRDLTIMGNFDPFTNVVASLGSSYPLLPQGPGGFLNNSIPIVIPPPQQGMMPGLPGVGMLGLVGNTAPAPGTLITTGGTGSVHTAFLRSLKDIVKLEIVNIHPGFVQAMTEMVAERDIATKSSYPRNRPSILSTSKGSSSDSEADEADAIDGTTPSPVSLEIPEHVDNTDVDDVTSSTVFHYLPALQHLEIIVHKACPITPQEFIKLFETRCLLKYDVSTKSSGHVASWLRPLEKFEVHLGAKVEEKLAEAVHTRMQLEGEERGASWFSWTSG